jgi:HNH endonuclease
MSEHDRSTPKSCTVSGCTETLLCKGLCSKHYWRFKRHGTLADPVRPSLIDRFLAKLGPRPQDGSCWEWQGARASAGHAVIWHDGKQIRASHVSWELYRGPVPSGMWVLHHCDNGPCVEPDHLFLGKAADNTRDMFTKGRQGRRMPPRHLGEAHPNAKVTNRQVLSIKRLLRLGTMTHAEIATLLDIPVNIIHHISSGKTWKQL